MNKSKQTIDHRRLEIIKRLEIILDNYKKGYTEIVDVQYFQTLDGKSGISIITELTDPCNIRRTNEIHN